VPDFALIQIDKRAKHLPGTDTKKEINPGDWCPKGFIIQKSSQIGNPQDNCCHDCDKVYHAVDTRPDSELHGKIHSIFMVIGLDPGTATLGFAIVGGSRTNPQTVEYGIIQTQKATAVDLPLRLAEIGHDLEHLLDKFKPESAVVEELFFFKNQKTVIGVAQSRGVILYTLAKRGIPVHSVTPLQLKQKLCGYGRATKKQVQEMVKKVYKMESVPKPDDAADALGLAWVGLKG
jgi:crossover junction endodeoxyribonuclease RuvC